MSFRKVNDPQNKEFGEIVRLRRVYLLNLLSQIRKFYYHLVLNFMKSDFFEKFKVNENTTLLTTVNCYYLIYYYC